MAERFWTDGEAFLTRGQGRAAQLRFAQVTALEPDFKEGWCALGDSFWMQELEDDAHRAWRNGGFHPRCLESQGMAWMEDHPVWSVQRFEALAAVSSQDPRVDLLLARARVTLDRAVAKEDVERFLDRSDSDDPLLAPVVLELLQSEPDPEDALEWLDAMVRRRPNLEPELADLRFDLDVTIRAFALMGASPRSLTPSQRVELERARRALAAGRVEAATAQLETLSRAATRSPDVWAALGNARLRKGEIAAAERALRLVTQLDPLAGGPHARLGRLLRDHYAGRRREEALACFERALASGASIRWEREHAELAVELGRPEEARSSLEHLAAQDDSWARSVLAGLDVALPELPVLPRVPRPEGISEGAWEDLHRGRVLLDSYRVEGDSDLLKLASDHALRSLTAHPDWGMALDLSAQVAIAGGDEEEAARLWEASLAVKPSAAVMLRLAESVEPEGARVWLERAAELGSGEANVRLAVIEAEANRWWNVGPFLDVYFTEHGSGPDHERALDLRRGLNQRKQILALVALAFVGLCLTAGGLAWRRRRRRMDLQTVVAREPALGVRVAPMLSAIRHEVLKHAVGAMSEVVDGLEEGRDSGWMEDRLYGHDGAVERFRAYRDEIESIAHLAGFPLDLRSKDTVFAPMGKAFDRLEALQGKWNARNTRALQAIAQTLTQTTYHDLGVLLRGLTVTTIDADWLQTVWDGVVREEPDHRGSLSFRVEGETMQVQMGERDIRDVVTNLLRNAAQASESGQRVGVRTAVDEDFITGLVRAEFRMLDEVTQPLTTAMIRGRYIDRGLGLAVELVTRGGGSVVVQPEPGWAKAVVVHIPMEEET